MTLQEKIFMCDLIKRNYRRRLIWFICENILTFLGIVGVTLILTNPLKFSAPFDIITPMVSIVFIVTGLALIIHDDNPKVIKKAQLKALKQHAEADFEELIHSVPLKEYFEI